MSVHKTTAAARDLFHLEAAHSSDSETESGTEWERPPDRAFCVDSLFDRSNARHNENGVSVQYTELALVASKPRRLWFMGASCLRGRGGGGKEDCGSGVLQGATFGQVARAALTSPSPPPRCTQQAAGNVLLLMAAVCVRKLQLFWGGELLFRVWR